MTVDVILTGSHANMTAQVKGMSDITHSAVRRNEADTGDVLGDTMYWRSRGAPHSDPNSPQPGSATSIASYRKNYRNVDGTKSANPYFYWRMEGEEDWNTLLASTNPTGILPGTGGSKILYASGLTVDPGIGNGDGTYGTAPSNGIQLTWA